MIDLERARALHDRTIELISKGVQMLLVAHGAGIAACVTLMKDYPGGEQLYLKGIGLFVTLFGLGFVSAIFAYSSLIGSTSHDARYYFGDVKEIKGAQFSLALFFSSASSVTLSLVVGLLINRLSSM